MFCVSPKENQRTGTTLNSTLHDDTFEDSLAISVTDRNFTTTSIKEFLFSAVMKELKKEKYEEFWDQIKETLTFNDKLNCQTIDLALIMEEVNTERKVFIHYIECLMKIYRFTKIWLTIC